MNRLNQQVFTLSTFDIETMFNVYGVDMQDPFVIVNTRKAAKTANDAIKRMMSETQKG